MTANKWDGTEDVALTVAERWDGTQWVTLTVAERWTGTEWVQIALPGGSPPPPTGSTLTVSVSPGVAKGTVNGDSSSPPFKTVTTNSVTVVSNGTAPFAYVWTKEDGDSAVLVTSPSAATTTFYGNVAKDNAIAANYRCTVTDDNGLTGYVILPARLLYLTDV